VIAWGGGGDWPGVEELLTAVRLGVEGPGGSWDRGQGTWSLNDNDWDREGKGRDRRWNQGAALARSLGRASAGGEGAVFRRATEGKKKEGDFAVAGCDQEERRGVGRRKVEKIGGYGADRSILLCWKKGEGMSYRKKDGKWWET